MLAVMVVAQSQQNKKYGAGYVEKQCQGTILRSQAASRIRVNIFFDISGKIKNSFHISYNLILKFSDAHEHANVLYAKYFHL